VPVVIMVRDGGRVAIVAGLTRDLTALILAGSRSFGRVCIHNGTDLFSTSMFLKNLGLREGSLPGGQWRRAVERRPTHFHALDAHRVNPPQRLRPRRL